MSTHKLWFAATVLYVLSYAHGLGEALFLRSSELALARFCWGCSWAFFTFGCIAVFVAGTADMIKASER